MLAQHLGRHLSKRIVEFPARCFQVALTKSKFRAEIPGDLVLEEAWSKQILERCGPLFFGSGRAL